jgi:hypothetical protein
MVAVALAVFLAASPSLSDARRLFERGRFEEALARLDSLSLVRGDSETANIQLLRARCLSALGRERDADSALALALAGDPEAEFGSSQVPPSLVDRLTGLRLLSRGYLAVDVKGLVASDVIEVDGAPFVDGIALSIGKHAVRVRTEGGNSLAAGTAVVRPGQKTKLSLQVVRPEPAPLSSVVVERATESQPPSPPSIAPAPSVRFSVFARSRVDLVAPFASSTPVALMGELGASLEAKWLRAGLFGFGSGGGVGLGARLGAGAHWSKVHLQGGVESLLMLSQIAVTLGLCGSLGYTITERVELALEVSVHSKLLSQREVVAWLVPVGVSLKYAF